MCIFSFFGEKRELRDTEEILIHYVKYFHKCNSYTGKTLYNSKTNKQTNKQTDKQTNKQTNGQTC